MMSSSSRPRFILTLSCSDVMGIVAAVSGFLAENGCFIIESAQFGDFSTGRFFMRCEFEVNNPALTLDSFRGKFSKEVAERFGMAWNAYDKASKPRLLVMVSRHGHCLNDLLHRTLTGNLSVEIAGVVSNHEDFRELIEWHKIPYHHLPITSENKREQEERILNVFREANADVVVLARYMQVLSPYLVSKLYGRAINIHHSFLPSFKGARPYFQAFDRGVKLIGATAHYVTEDLDEGPIIEQEVERVDHTATPEELTAVGRDTEALVLARALRYHIEHRVLINGRKTVVFR